jgi:hypothetical protein
LFSIVWSVFYKTIRGYFECFFSDWNFFFGTFATFIGKTSQIYIRSQSCKKKKKKKKNPWFVQLSKTLCLLMFKSHNDATSENREKTNC